MTDGLDAKQVNLTGEEEGEEEEEAEEEEVELLVR